MKIELAIVSNHDGPDPHVFVARDVITLWDDIADFYEGQWEDECDSARQYVEALGVTLDTREV